MSEVVFTNADAEKLGTIPAEAFVRLYDAAEKLADDHVRWRKLPRRQRELVRLLDLGWVLELAKPLRQRVSRRYLMRSPLATETDGPVVNARTADRLIEAGFAIRVTLPWNDKTWVYSRSVYERSPMGMATSRSTSTPSTDSTSSSTPESSPSPTPTEPQVNQ